ncbi:hypothetical protein IW150_006985, partial [Coemansia sp. RSA 2607]
SADHRVLTRSARSRPSSSAALIHEAAEQRGYASSPTRPASASGGRQTRPSTLRRQRRLESPAQGESDGAVGGNATPTRSGRRPGRRKVVPELVASMDAAETESGAATPLFVAGGSPPPAIDKPREERSFREFFPDLDVHSELQVLWQGDEAAEASQASSAASDAPMTASDRPATASRTPSSLSIRLVFNDPEAPPTPRQQQQQPPPPLRAVGRGKSALSYSGAGQASAVVLAPKRPVVGLPETRFRHVSSGGGGSSVQRAQYQRPQSHYVRSGEVTEKELAQRVEYDLDDVDRCWLAALNGERTCGSGDVAADVLEQAMDAVEKEWFDVAKDAQKAIAAQQQEQLPADEAACAVCGSDECDNANAIVFCDGCNMAVHQDCYGVPYIPEGQWLCRRCMLSPDKDAACVLCPQRGGALKKTTANKWAHVLCALWIPEVFIANAVYMEPIDCVDHIPR